VKDTGHLVDAILETGCDGIGVDWRTDIGFVAARAAERASGPAAVQGNVDPTMLFAPPEAIRAAVHRARRAVDGRTGHVLNLGHGILPPTPLAGMSAFLDAAMEPLA
jgi:uroporphyrinogen decarboxylase